MTDSFIRHLLRVSVAQVCQTIGYHATQATALEVLEDVAHRFLLEFCRDLHAQAEHCNRIEANLKDVVPTLLNLNVSVPELLDYINNVEPVSFAHEIPKFPYDTGTDLKFLRPGCTEARNRPEHIYDYLPPMFPPSPPAAGTTPTNISPNENAPNIEDEAKAVSSSYQILNEETSGLTSSNATTNGTPKAISSPYLCGYGFSSNKRMEYDFPLFGKFVSYEDEAGRGVRELTLLSLGPDGSIIANCEGKVAEKDIVENIDEPCYAPQTGSAALDSGNISLNSSSAILNKDSTAPHNVPVNLESSIPSADGRSSINTLIKDSVDVGRSTHNSASTKKFSANQHQSNFNVSQTPTMASKLLKKAKKKGANSTLAGQGKFSRNDSQNTHNPNYNPPGGYLTALNNSDAATDKIERKCIKMLQKLSKVKNISSIKDLFGPDGKFKGILNPALLTLIPAGPERQQLEKLLKKQAKQKQKQIKQLLTKEGKSKRGDEQQQLFTPDGVIGRKIPQGKLGQDLSAAASSMHGRDSKLAQPTKHGDMRPLSVSPTKYFPGNSQHMPSNVLDQMQPVRDLKAIVDSNTGENKHDSGDIVPARNNSMEIKLSTEPNRSKLNIFKKISKQKNLKSPNINKLPSGTTIIDNSDGPPVINLPSGTTITPAPPTSSGQHVYSPDIQVTDLNDPKLKNSNANITGPPGLIGPTASNVSVFNAASSYEGDINMINKPKKRGRKPGQKNHAKLAGSVEAASTSKKAKKAKLDHSAYGGRVDTMDISSEVTVEPLNLTNPDQFENRYDMLPNFGTGGIPKPMMSSESMVFPISAKERKERKKAKTKNMPAGNFAADVTKASLGVPTKEEFNLINEKLLRMDTVMQSTLPVPSLSVPLDFKKVPGDVSSSKSVNSSPTKTMSSAAKSPSSKKRAQSKIPPSPMLGGTLPSPFMPPVGGGFPTFQRNMLSMLPMYPFPPRPGLIPPPGLFPTPGLGNFATNPAGAASSMLLGGFLPFPNLKPVTSSAVANQDKIEADKLPIVPPPMGDRSYCNVAPLVPESMKLTPPDTSITKSKRDERDGQKAPKSKHNPMFGEQPSDSSISKKPSASSFAKSSAIGNLEGSHFQDNYDDKPIGGQSGMQPKPGIDLGTMDAPIELSDDSVDMSVEERQGQGSNTPSSKTKFKHSLIKMPILAGTELGGSDDNLYGKVKKMKKSSKSSKKHNLIGATETSSSFELFTPEKPSKLAGGAELISLPSTSQAHSTKTAVFVGGPMGATVTPTFAVSKKDMEKSSNIFDDLTITSSSGLGADLQKKRKEHKKLKKTKEGKEGKIKKKKDKKDKSKSKERSEKHLLKAEKILKDKDLEKYKEVDFIKKLKKEKKKEKQRLSIDPSSLKPSLSPGSMEACNAEKSQHQTITATADSTVAFGSNSANNNTTVPKLTLKLGEREKKELSPELARIAPLITRPPKPKSSITDNPQATTSASNEGGAEFQGDNKLTGGNIVNVLSSKNMVAPPSPWFSGGTISASSVLLPQQLMQPVKMKDTSFTSTSSNSSTVTSHSEEKPSSSKAATDKQNPVSLLPEANRPSSYIDAEGNRVWICPACGKVDDGSPMIGCDGCDAWYHWVCVGIFIAPKDNEDWFCRVCITKKKSAQGSDKKRKRTKKK